MEKCIVYLHGWKGNPEANTKKALEVAFPGVKVVAFPIEYDTPDLWRTELDLTVEILKVLNHYRHDEIIIFGNSAGGFWAQHFASVFHTHLVMTNPSFNLGETLAKYGVVEETLAQYRDFHPMTGKELSCQVFLSGQDEVLDNSAIPMMFDDVTILPGEGHRIQNLEPVINKLKETLINEDIQNLPGRAVR